MTEKPTIEAYEGPAGGWGSAKSVARHVFEQGAQRIAPHLHQQNKPEGFACVSCAWAKPAEPHPLEFCENGLKATAWELGTPTIGAEFFAKHSATELRTWPDHDLEKAGRLTEPMRFDHATDRWMPVSWDEAFAQIGRDLQRVDPHRAVFYASGRASLETSYLYALFARMFGSNNLPDSSNMCHETTSVALPQSIGIPVGTVRLEDFSTTDLCMFFGQNTGSNSPRMLHQLEEVRKREIPVITFNPLRERGLERFTNPQNPLQMATGQEIEISTQYHQVEAGGDLAALTGLCKSVLALDDAAREGGSHRVLDVEFIARHTHGFEALESFLRGTAWSEIEAKSGLTRAAIEEAAFVYARASSVLAMYGMGLTQHRNGVATVHMLMNLLLMRGNIGRDGAGICPVRGHSNVQGQRTVGISEKPELVPLDRLAEQYAFEPPRWEGMSTVDVCRAVVDRRVEAFIGLGGNFLRAVPETGMMEESWPDIDLTVQIATKLNRTHLINGRSAWLLPCRGRIEIDEQASGPQAVTIEDSTACIHGSRGVAAPSRGNLLSEPRIVAGLAAATLPPNPKIDWDHVTQDYARIRDLIEATYPDQFERFNERMWTPGGFPRPLAARKREWNTDTGKANFLLPQNAGLTSHDLDLKDGDLRLITLRSNDQFNTTIYGYRDRFRGVEGTRMVLFISETDMRRFSLSEGQEVSLVSEAGDGIERVVAGLRVTRTNIPAGCVGGYYPECNPLMALAHFAKESKVPAAKSVPVSIRI
ncbi:MAG: formate dehydrogenase [Hyphomicrobiales bacterium]|nr:formate dehydrogenase [Hyphomicrobiales bacterium]